MVEFATNFKQSTIFLSNIMMWLILLAENLMIASLWHKFFSIFPGLKDDDNLDIVCWNYSNTFITRL